MFEAAALAAAHEAHHDPDWAIEDLARAVSVDWRSTFAAPDATAEAFISDDQAALRSVRRGVRGRSRGAEWPELPAPNIFFPALMLKSLGWPVEKDRRAAADARFLDLLGSASQQVTVSTFTLDEDALVSPSTQLDEIPRARLSIVEEESPSRAESQAPPPADWAGMRRERLNAALPVFHGSLGPQKSRPWAVSALETYLGCPFRFFAQHVLKLEEEPDDEEVMDPRRQGQLVHEVFETFFRDWQAAVARSTPEHRSRVGDVRKVSSIAVARRPGRSRLGARAARSSAAAGLGEAVFGWKPSVVAVVERLLELSSKADSRCGRRRATRRAQEKPSPRLLSDGSFRLIDYSSDGRRIEIALCSCPSTCAETQLADVAAGRGDWARPPYLAFKGPKREAALQFACRSRQSAPQSARAAGGHDRRHRAR